MNAAVGNPIRGGGSCAAPDPDDMAATLLRIGSVILLVAAFVLAVLAFTRFGDAGAPAPGSSGPAGYGEGMTRTAQLSVVLGVAASACLLGAFACHERAGRSRPAAADPPRGP